MKLVLRTLLTGLLLYPAAATAQTTGETPSACSSNYYWFVQGSSPSTQVWSNSAGAFVALADPGYTAFSILNVAGNLPSTTDVNAAINACNLTTFSNVRTFTAQTITTDTQLTNPLAAWYDFTNTTSDGLKVKLPQVNIPGGPPIGATFTFNNSNTSSTKTLSIRGFGDTSLGAQVLYPQSTVIATLKSNATQDGTWAFYYPTFQAGAGNAGALAYSNTESWTVLANPGGAGYLLGYNNATSAPQWQNNALSSAARGYPYFNVNVASVDFNTTAPADIGTFVIAPPTTNYRFAAVMISQCTASISSAHFEIWTAAGGTGTKLLNDTTGAVTTASANTSGSLQVTSPSISTFVNTANLYLRLITAQGSPATCSVVFQMQPLP
jgi:hypothetical protein